MPDPALESMRLTALRSRAAGRLGGLASGQAGAAGFSVALATLHALASSPATAADALALLHELQVHQVELELQSQDLLESRAELEAELRRQAARHEAQPVGLFTIDAGLVVQESNRTGEAMLGIPSGDGVGVGLGGFLAADSGRVLQGWVSRALGDGSAVAGKLQLGHDGAGRTVIAHVRGQPDAGVCLVVLTDDLEG